MDLFKAIFEASSSSEDEDAEEKPDAGHGNVPIDQDLEVTGGLPSRASNAAEHSGNSPHLHQGSQIEERPKAVATPAHAQDGLDLDKAPKPPDSTGSPVPTKDAGLAPQLVIASRHPATRFNSLGGPEFICKGGICQKQCSTCARTNLATHICLLHVQDAQMSSLDHPLQYKIAAKGRKRKGRRRQNTILNQRRRDTRASTRNPAKRDTRQ